MTPIIEVCIEGPDAAVAAEQGGADRVELCASLAEGGITPSLGVLHAALAAVRIPVMAMVRPRGGDFFLYSDREFAAMLQDAGGFRDAGAAGIVCGCLTAAGAIDTARMAALVAAARPLPVTCHRAFDMVRDPDAALDALIAAGVHRVLTSGLRPTAIEGLSTLRRLVARAAGRIIVLGCGALTPETIAAVRDAGLPELHFSAPKDVASPMQWCNPTIAMGATDVAREYRLTVTDPERVRAMIAAVRTVL